MARTTPELNNRMDQQDAFSEKEDIWDTFTQMPYTMNPITTASLFSPTPWPPAPQSVEYDSSTSTLDLDSNFEPFLNCDTPLFLDPLDFEEDFQSTPLAPTEVVSPAASVSTSGLSALSPNSPRDGSDGISSTSGISGRIVTKRDLEHDPRLRDAIQTVTEYRKSRRRAQNRFAQQAFKGRKRQHEKELAEQIVAAEKNFRALEAQNQRLRDDLERKRRERSSSVVASAAGGKTAQKS